MERERLAAPNLSVVVVVLSGGDCLARCLDSLSGQAAAAGAEIIVPCDDGLEDVARFVADYPGVDFVRSRGRRSCAELRSIGVKRAAGEIVAVTEDHCTPEPTWCESIANAHLGPHAAVGGAVEKRTPGTRLSWALYFADYVRYAGHRPEGASRHLTDCNVSYKRSALEPVSEVWSQEFHEPAVHRALEARGESLWFDPRIVVRQQRRVRLLEAIKDRYAFGRLFGSGRVASSPAGRRLLLAALAVPLPALLVARSARHALGGRRYVVPFLLALPHLTLLAICWASGELVGYLTGRPGEYRVSGLHRSNEAAGRGREVAT